MKVIGASIIGHPCEKFIWYSHMNMQGKVDEKTQAIFDEGKRLETEVINQLIENGEQIINTGENQIWVHHPVTNLIGGFLDGIGISGEEKYVLEIKSANDRRFNEFKRKGVISNPQYLSQLNCYLKWTNCKEGKWIVVNKSTNELYEEWFEFNEERYDRDMSRVWNILGGFVPQKRPNFSCKYCEYADYCHGKKLPNPDCRLCNYGVLITHKDEFKKKYCHSIYDFLITNCTEEQRLNCSISRDECEQLPYWKCPNAQFNYETKWGCYKEHEFGTVCEEFIYKNSLCKDIGFIPIGTNTYIDDYGEEIPLTNLQNCLKIKDKMDLGYAPRC